MQIGSGSSAILDSITPESDARSNVAHAVDIAIHAFEAAHQNCKKVSQLTREMAEVTNDVKGVKKDMEGMEKDIKGVKKDMKGVKKDMKVVKSTTAKTDLKVERMTKDLSELLRETKRSNEKLSKLVSAT